MNARTPSVVVAKVVYLTPSPVGTSLYPEIPFVHVERIETVEDLPIHTVIVPEIYRIDQIRHVLGWVHCKYVVWWQSFINACKIYALSNLDLENVVHAFHSFYEYAMVRPHLKRPNPELLFLTDFIAEHYLQLDTSSFLEEKRPVVCFNGHKDETSRYVCAREGIPFVEIRNMERQQVNDVLRQCQVYVDMGTHPGKDHMPREASMYGCVVITNKSGSAAYHEDVPIDEKIAFEEELVPMIRRVFADYRGYYDKQESYRQFIREEKDKASANVDVFLTWHEHRIAKYDRLVFVSQIVYRDVMDRHGYILQRLEDICVTMAGVHGVEGNCFCENGNVKNRLTELHAKQLNLFSLGISATNVMEIGFNAGHSALLFLLANETSKVVCFDDCRHSYTWACYYYLRSIFGDRLHLVCGDSRETVPQFHQSSPDTTFDVVHMDGSHDVETVRQDVQNTMPMMTDVMIMDDTQVPCLNSLVDEYVNDGGWTEVPMRRTLTYEHRILRRRRDG